MLARLIRTANHPTPLVARLVLAVIFFAHGAQKALGWFGGGGMDAATAQYVALGLPGALGGVVAIVELVGAVLLAIGLLGRLAAAAIIADLVLAVALVHHRHGFFMNWSGDRAGEGFEYHLLALGLAVIVLVSGSGAASIDRALTHRFVWSRR